jgi:hypothetical protein
MAKRLQLDLLLDDLSTEELSFLSSLKEKSSEGTAKVHNCGHKDGKKCVNVVDL